MCVVSFVGDWGKKTFEPYIAPIPNTIPDSGTTQFQWVYNPVTREEFDALKAKVEKMIDLLKKAKEIDVKTGQPDCEQEEKLAALRAVAEHFGFDLEFLGGKDAKVTVTDNPTGSKRKRRA